MVPLAHLIAFAVTVVVMVAIPGPSVLFTISRALTVGRRATLCTVAGNAMGVLVQVLAVAFGMGAVVETSALAYSTVKYVGALYIVYLGVQAIRHRHSMADALADRVAAVRPLSAARDGFIVGVTNPEDDRDLGDGHAGVRRPGSWPPAAAIGGTGRALSGHSPGAR